MAPKANEIIARIKPYKIASQDIWDMPPAQRDRTLKLDWNEATIMPSPEIKKALLKLIQDEEFYQYYPATYNRELVAALANYAGVYAENVQYFVGSDTLHEYIAKCFVEKNDTVIILWPTYDNFRYVAEIAGAQIKFELLDEAFQLDNEHFERALREEKPRLAYVCNPNNPTGTLLEPSLIEGWIEKFPDTMFVIDEAYGEFSGVSVNHLTRKYENLLVTHTMSKAFSLANFRFGYLIASEHNIDLISRARNAKNISTISQVAALASLKDVEYMHSYAHEVCLARDWLIEQIRAMDCRNLFRVYDSQANFFVIKFRNDDLKLRVKDKLKERRIYIRDLVHGYPVENSLRVTVGTRAQMEYFFQVFTQVIQEVAEEENNGR